MRLIALALLVTGFLISALGCSSLKIGTEVYDHERAATDVTATKIVVQLDAIPHQISASRERAMNAWTRGKDGFPGLYLGEAKDFADSYEQVLRGIVEKEFGWRITSVKQEARDLASGRAGKPENVPVITDPAEDFRRLAQLQFRFENLVNDLNARLQQVANTNKQQAVKDVLDSMSLTLKPPNDGVKKLSAMTQVTITDDATLDTAKAELKRRVFAGELAVSPEAIQAKGLEEFTAPFKSTAKETTEAVLLPMGDPIVPRVTGAGDQYWKQYYNRVTGSTTLGNAEIAVKMQTLGVYSMKGVVFDPSQVSQAIIDGIETAVVVAAAASGAPVSIASRGAKDGGADEMGAQTTTSKARTKAEMRDLERKAITRAKARATLYNDLLEALKSVNDLSDGDTNLKPALESAVEKIETQAAVIKSGRKP
jgi:hypothetical protein